MGRRRASKPEGESGGSKRRRTSAPNPKKEDEDVKDTEGKSTGGGNVEISKPEAKASGSAVHPLLIDHVLEKVFQHIICPKSDAASASLAKDVRNLRLVCKQWKDTATRIFRRNRAPMLSFGEISGPCTKSPNEKMQKFLDVMKSSDLIPVQRYTLNPRFFVNENQQIMKDFMNICGPDAAELHLYFDNFCTMKFTRRSFPDLNLMGLKTLAFHAKYCPYGKQTPTYEIAYLPEVILTAAENLQEVQFIFAPEYQYRRRVWPHALAKKIGDCTFKRIPKNVKLLHLGMPLNDSHVNILAESELKLEEFKFHSQFGASSEVIRKFFEKQAATLKVLNIFDSTEYGKFLSLDFPRFDELLHLDLSLWRGTIQTFSFPDTFPKLTSLNIAQWSTESSCVEFLNCCTKKGMSLKEIYLPSRFAQAPLVMKAAQFFPNISKLHISASQDIPETLPEVFVYFDNIEELCIKFPCKNELNLDSILSGVSPRDCQEIMEQRNFDMSISNFLGRPSILNLTKLKKLVLKHPLNIVLTDFSVRFIFLKMASLKELHTDQREISAECVELLRKNLSLNLTAPYYSHRRLVPVPV